MDSNQEIYNSKTVVNWYTQLTEIIPVEKKIIEYHKEFIQNGDLLDIGIGGGRTTHYLINKCKSYTGIDYSENFVATVKKTYPEASCYKMDARDLSSFRSGSFDFVNFSFNGVDYVDLEGRKKIFAEILRVLKPEGLFFFSTHNKNHRSFHVSPWLSEYNTLITNIKTFIKLVPHLLKKHRQRKNEIIEDGYAIINDSAHNYSLMTFYTSPEFLNSQLMDAGFELIQFYSKSGELKEDSELDDWIFVTAKRKKA